MKIHKMARAGEGTVKPRPPSARACFLLGAVVATLLAAALSLVAWWARTAALRPESIGFLGEVVVLLLALLAFDATIHPMPRPSARLRLRGEEAAVLINALALTFLAGTIALTTYTQVATRGTEARSAPMPIAGAAFALLTLLLNGMLVMGRQSPGCVTGSWHAMVVAMLQRVVRSGAVLVASLAVVLTQAPGTSPIIAFPTAGLMIWVSWRIIREHEQSL